MTSTEAILMVGFGLNFVVLLVLGGHILHLARQLDRITACLENNLPGIEMNTRPKT